jgi:hypothetical protein
MKSSRNNKAVVGVSDHAGWAVLITVAHDGTIVDRRRVELIDAGLPSMPHHHDAQALPVAEAVELIARVRLSIERHASLAFEALATDVASPIQRIALRTLQPLPPTIADRIRDYRARNVADWVMYREALATAAESRGWLVHWYDPKTVFDAASEALHAKTLDGHFLHARKTLGAPWNKDHKLAMAAAIAGQAEDVSA